VYGNDLMLMFLLHCFQDLVQSLDDGRSKLSVVSDLSRSVIRNTSDDGCQIVEAEIKQVGSDYTNLKLTTQAAKENVEKQLQDWIDLWKKAESLSTWIRDTELKLGSDQEFGRDIFEKKLLLEQTKVF